MEWGKDDCVTDIFGEDAHQRISWLKEDHNDTLLFVLSLTEQERWDLFRATFEGQGFIKVDKAQPGDCAIGIIRMGIDDHSQLPAPWFAQMGVDCNWYMRMPTCIRVVEAYSDIEVYRCQRLR